MSGVKMTYRGLSIGEMSDSGTKTLKTAGKYCEADIVVKYTAPSTTTGTDELAKKLITGDGLTTSFSLPEDIDTIRDYAFYNLDYLAITSLPSSVTEIGDYAFYNCSTNIASLPSSLYYIGRYAFARKNNASTGYGLVFNSLPEGLLRIGDYAFANLYKGFNLTYLPSTIKTIGGYIFSNCTAITTITFKGTPTSIDSSAFKDCSNLTTINVPWSKGAVSGAPWGAKLTTTINYNYTES